MGENFFSRHDKRADISLVILEEKLIPQNNFVYFMPHILNSLTLKAVDTIGNSSK